MFVFPENHKVLGTPNPLSPAEQNIYKICIYCYAYLVNTATQEHVLPRSRGGYVSARACLPCNHAKGHMTLEEFKETTYYKFHCRSKIWEGYIRRS